MPIQKYRHEKTGHHIWCLTIQIEMKNKEVRADLYRNQIPATDM